MHRAIEGSMVMVDISKFIKMSEPLPRPGKVGSEEGTDVVDSTFAQPLPTACPRRQPPQVLATHSALVHRTRGMRTGRVPRPSYLTGLSDYERSPRQRASRYSVMFVLNGHGTFHVLVIDANWNLPTFKAWLYSTLVPQLLAPGQPALRPRRTSPSPTWLTHDS